MMADWLDRTDLKILQILQQEGRTTNVELANQVALSPTPCLRRVKRLEEAGLIRGYRAELDRRKIGLGVTAFVHVNVSEHTPAATEAFLTAAQSIEQIISCHVLAGTFDFLLEVVTSNLDEYSNVMLGKLGSLPGVKAIQSTFSLGSMVNKPVLPVASAFQLAAERSAPPDLANRKRST